MTFRTVLNPSDAELQPLQDANPANPFASVPYIAARRELGATVVLFSVERADAPPTAAVGYLTGRSYSRTLDLSSAPSCPDTGEFWNGVRHFCRENRVANISVDSYCSQAVSLPSWSAPSQLRDRIEWVLQLNSPEEMRFGSNHRRNINKARKLGVTVTATSDCAAASVHGELMAASMRRRALRGERVPTVKPAETRYECAFLRSGAARLFQAVLNDSVVSSLLVLQSPTGAYYQSAGTTPEGLEVGASTFLVSEIIRALASEGRNVFNLGGALPEAEGLTRFKSGFGAQPVPLMAGTYRFATPVQKGIQAAVRLLREPLEIGRSFTQRFVAS